MLASPEVRWRMLNGQSGHSVSTHPPTAKPLRPRQTIRPGASWRAMSVLRSLQNQSAMTSGSDADRHRPQFRKSGEVPYQMNSAETRDRSQGPFRQKHSERRNSRRTWSIDDGPGRENRRPPELRKCWQKLQLSPFHFTKDGRQDMDINRTNATPSTKPQRFAIASLASQCRPGTNDCNPSNSRQ